MQRVNQRQPGNTLSFFQYVFCNDSRENDLQQQPYQINAVVCHLFGHDLRFWYSDQIDIFFPPDYSIYRFTENTEQNSFFIFDNCMFPVLDRPNHFAV